MSELERLKKVLKIAFNKINIYKKADMAKHLGYTNSYFSEITNGKEKLSDSFLKEISDILDINSDWVLTGNGNMFNCPDDLEDSILENTQMFYGGEDFEIPTYVPLLPISAQGGSLNDFIVSVKDSDCERIISPIKGADFAMTVAGDSMSPEYPSGSQILIKKINERAFIDWGKVYVLDTCNGSVIKRIFPADDKDPNKVKCVSINPDYPPFEVSLEDVYGVYRVLLSMSVK